MRKNAQSVLKNIEEQTSMININNKPWSKLRSTDIQKFLSGTEDENFFFEFKADEETPAKLVKEISAFANTYGGYILLGINDDKTIGGCEKWTEQRIHAAIHDSLTPIPNFDVKKFIIDEKRIFVIKIEEGIMPPYITNKGQIFERVSSGSFPVKESSRVTQMLQKRNDQLIRIKNKIELPEIQITNQTPSNLFGYLDFGFSLTCSEKLKLEQDFYKIEIHPIADYIKSVVTDFSISLVGGSYLFSLGKITPRADNDTNSPVIAGINNFIEIMYDGSVRGRVLLFGPDNSTCADITLMIYFQQVVFKKIYSMLVGNELQKIFIQAHKYEKLTVLKQFEPMYCCESGLSDGDKTVLEKYLKRHKECYGNNLVIESDRFPKNDYVVIDRRYFSNRSIKYNVENLVVELFDSVYFNLGYIEPMPKL